MAPVQQSRRRKHKNARANRQELAASRVGVTQGIAKFCGNGLVNAAPAGDHHQIGGIEQRQIAIREHPNATRRPQFALIYRRDGKTIPVIAHFRARQAEDLHRNPKFEGTKAVISQDYHAR
ncbi:hypothetical protein D3C86_1666110 [compost metagenome]